MNDRRLVPALGFPIDGATFEQHRVGCSSCQQYEFEKPATLAKLCLDGAILLKKDNAQPVERDSTPLSSYHTSAAKARKLMQYK